MPGPRRQPGSQPQAHGCVEESPSCILVDVKGTLVFDQLVDMVLCPVLAGGDFEDKSNDEQGLL